MVNDALGVRLLLEKLVHEVRPDEPCTAGYEISRAHESPPFSATLAVRESPRQCVAPFGQGHAKSRLYLGAIERGGQRSPCRERKVLGSNGDHARDLVL